jgi:hypothetical protein
MKRSLVYGVVVAALTLAASSALAANISFSNAISPDDFKTLSKEAGAMIGYKNLAPAEPLGITGFDIGVEASATSINKDSAYWSAAFGNNAPSYVVLPKVRARKGLPFGIDIGAMYSYVPDSNIKLYGAELSKAILDGGMASPAFGVRATYTKLAGVDDLALQTYGVDASISKGFLFLTPYAGAGYLWISSEAKGHLQSLAPLKSDTSIPRFFAGLKISPLPLFGITAEAEYSERPVYSLKAAISF